MLKIYLDVVEAAQHQVYTYINNTYIPYVYAYISLHSHFLLGIPLAGFHTFLHAQ